MKKVKRYLTRSIKEIFDLFEQQNPDIKMSRSKFYTLRPKWVMINPVKDVCLCVYCANFELCLITLKNVRKESYSELRKIRSDILPEVMCFPPTESCTYQEYVDCPGAASITLQSLGLHDTDGIEEITFATWDHGDLQKRSTSLSIFINELAKWTLKASAHLRIKDIQRTQIKEEKKKAKCDSRHLVLYGDFAENWTVIMKDAIQSYHWKNEQVSIFTAVCYQGDMTTSLTVVSNDTKHDSAHALLAMSR